MRSPRCLSTLLPLVLVSECRSFVIESSSFPPKRPQSSSSSTSSSLLRRLLVGASGPPRNAHQPDLGSDLLLDRRDAKLDVKIREATKDEAAEARNVLLRHAMNPLFVDDTNLLVATTTPSTGGAGGDSSSRVIGFGQIRPLPSDEEEAASPSRSYSDANEKEMPSWWELASLYVDPDFRRKGVGTTLIRELLRRHDDRQKNPAPEGKGGISRGQEGGSSPKDWVVLLTLAPTAPLYEPHGFRVVEPSSSSMFPKLPRSVRFEHAAGTALSWVLGNQLVCMVRSPEAPSEYQ